MIITQFAQAQTEDKRIKFQGATRTLKKCHFKTKNEIVEVFTKHPNSDGIAGSLPNGWLENIKQLPKDKKSYIIKNVYKFFRDNFAHNHNEKELVKISKKFTNKLRELGVIPQTNQVVVKKKNARGATIAAAYTIKERGENKTLEPLFIKLFRRNLMLGEDKEGAFAELALGLHLKKLLGNEHILNTYFGDTKGRFLVSKYEISPQNVKIPKPLTLDELFNQKDGLKNYFENLKTITKDNVDFKKLLEKYGFVHKDLHDQNVVITKNKQGKLRLKLIDLGKIVKIEDKR